MENEKLCGAMVRLPESRYYELRRLALERRTTFNRFAREILERYLKKQTGSKRSEPLP